MAADQIVRSPLSSADVIPAPNSSARAVPSARGAGRAIVIQLLAWGATIPTGLVVTALLAHYLGPTQYGEYTFTLPFLSVFALLGSIGMDPLVIRQLSRRGRAEWGEVLSYATGTRLLSSSLAITAAFCVALALPVGATQRALLLLGSFSLLFSFQISSFRLAYDNAFRAEQRVSIPALLLLVDRLVTAGLVVLVVVLHLSLLWAYVLITYSDVPFFLAEALISRRRFGVRVRFSLARAREHLRTGLPMLSYDALVQVAWRADLFVLMALAGPVSVGIYALALRVTDPLFAVVMAYVVGLYPLLCTKFEEGHAQFALIYREATRLLALGIIPFAIVVSVQADAIVRILGGRRYLVAVPALQFLMWATAVGFFAQLAVRTAMSANLERYIPWVMGTSAGVNVVMNLALIPHWQGTGAGIAALLSVATELLLFTILLARHAHLFPPVGVVLRVLAGNIPALAFLLWRYQLPVLLAGPAFMLLVIAGCAAMRTLSVGDVIMARQLFLSRGRRNVTVWPEAGSPRQTSTRAAHRPFLRRLEHALTRLRARSPKLESTSRQGWPGGAFQAAGAAPPLHVTHVTLVRGSDAFTALYAEWEDLLRRAMRPTVFQGPDWLRSWWHVLGVGEAWLVQVRDAAGTLVGIVPLQLQCFGVGPLRLRLLRWLGYGKGALTDTVGPVFAAGYEAAAAQAALSYLSQSQTARAWDLLDMARVSATFAEVASEWALQAGYKARIYTSAACLYIHLADDWATLQRTLSKNLRSNLHRYRNRLHREGHCDAVTILTEPEAVLAALPRFFELHQLRARAKELKWHSDYFATPSSRTLLAEAAQVLSAHGKLAVAQMEVDGTVVAAQLLLIQGQVMTTYFSGFDPAWSRYSVMLLTTKACVEYAIAHGMRWVDLTVGAGRDDQTKRQWGTDEEQTKHVMIVRPSPSGLLAEWALRQWYIMRRLRMWSRKTYRKPLLQMLRLPVDEEQQAPAEPEVVRSGGPGRRKERRDRLE